MAAGFGAGFDLQAHRGGAGLMVENTMAAFGNALRIGVTTLECDVNLSADDVAMITHDPVLSPTKVRDTAPATPGDPLFPYAGKPVAALTRAQLATLDCGSQTQPQWPGQRAVPGQPMPTFAGLLDLVRRTPQVRVNVEIKHDVDHPALARPREAFVEVMLRAIAEAGLVERVGIQSFDWASLRLVGAVEPRIRRYALTNTRYLEVGKAGASPWLGGLDIDDVGGHVVAAVAELGFDAVSPAYHPFVTAELIAEARAAGVAVVPYTVDEPDTMARLIDLGVDGFITNYPDRARGVLVGRGVEIAGPPPTS